MEATGKQLDDAFLGLLQEAEPIERQELDRFYRENPEVARVAIRESAEVLMQAKCVRYDTSGADHCFSLSVKKLASLSKEHPAVGNVFRVVSRLDLADPAGDPLYDPAMKRIVQHRIARVISCLV